METNRIEREKAFHDDRFEQVDPRKKVKKYYTVVQGTKARYRSKIIELCQGKRVLEIGCGRCGTTRVWHNNGAAHVTGIDISSEGIKKAKASAREKNLPIDYFDMNAEEMTFEDNSFDIIVGTGVIHHLDLETIYKEMSRLLTDDGHAIFEEPLAHNPIVNIYRFFTPKLRTPDEHPLKMGDIKMAQAYFHNVVPEYYHMLSLGAFPFRNTRYFEKIMKALNSADQLLFRAFPFLKRYAWVTLLHFSKPKKTSKASDSA